VGYDRDTIAAISTAPGRGAIGIVRVSGPAVRDLTLELTGITPAPRHATYTAFRDTHGAVIDRGLCLYFPAPASYTGEDLVEFQLHGSLPLLRELLATLFRRGARAARPGEFTERAFLNGRMDLMQAEAVASIIDSATTQAARAAVNACDGVLSAHLEKLTEALRALRVQFEAVIDFGDDVPSTETEAHGAARLLALREHLADTLRDARRGARLAQGLDVAIVGRPNCGKSTLLNRLCGEDRAIVTSIPGTTRDVLSVDLDIAGLAVRLHDTAGLRDTHDPVEQQGVERAWRRLAQCDLALHLRAPDVADDGLAEELLRATGHAVPVLTVLNKCDLINTPAGAQSSGTIAISARSGAGLEDLRTAILEQSGATAAIEAPYIARARHVHALENAAAAVDAASAEFKAGMLELAAEQLAIAQRELEELTGVYTTEDLLGDIFANFCIGK
jgi:tRNA modification GTPase